jgi:hypothetical protein
MAAELHQQTGEPQKGNFGHDNGKWSTAQIAIA